MTFVRSEKNYKLIFIMLALTLALAMVGLILLYNRTVNLKHGIADMKSDIQGVGAETASLKERFFAIFDPQKVEELAKAQGLVKEKKPTYLEVNPWVLASQQ